MKEHFVFFACIVFILPVAGNGLFAQPIAPPAVRTTPSPVPTTPPAVRTTPSTVQATPEESGESSRTRELAEQLRRSRAAQQSRSGAQGNRQQGLLAMNLVGLETFGDALGNIPGGTDVITSEYRFTLNKGMFVSQNLVSTLFTADLMSLNGLPAISFSQSGVLPSNKTTLTEPAGVASEIVAYLGRNGSGPFDIDVDLGLTEYAKSHGIDPSQLTFDPNNSYVEFNSGIFTDGQIAYNYVAEYLIPSVPGKIYGLGRQKITENMTPVPTDRFIFDYSYFHNVPLPTGKMPVNRFTIGIEKTFFDKCFSFEVRLPFAATIDHTLYTSNENRLNVVRVGDVTAVLKYLVFKHERLAMTLGLGMSLPLAEDTHLIDSTTGRELIRSKHQSLHLMPYVGFLYVPHDRVFFQSYFQVDADANGGAIYVADLAGEGMILAGRARERTYAYTSLSLGYWLFRNYDLHEGLQNGMNLMGELHWTQSLDRATGVRHEQDNYVFDIGNEQGNYTVVNMTLGTRYLFNEKTNVGIGYSVPLRSANRQFDGELRLAFNRYF